MCRYVVLVAVLFTGKKIKESSIRRRPAVSKKKRKEKTAGLLNSPAQHQADQSPRTHSPLSLYSPDGWDPHPLSLI
jgi:hypothetical protein